MGSHAKSLPFIVLSNTIQYFFTLFSKSQWESLSFFLANFYFIDFNKFFQTIEDFWILTLNYYNDHIY